jgi:RNAse (barnase) inhibitor barstar
VTVVYVIDGSQVESLEDFWRLTGEAVNGPGGYYGSNLEAFNDCLSGGFGTPEDDDFMVKWRGHELSREVIEPSPLGQTLAMFDRVVTRVSGLVSPEWDPAWIRAEIFRE